MDPNLAWSSELQFLSLMEFDLRYLNWQFRFQNATKKHKKIMEEERPLDPFAPDHILKQREAHRKQLKAEKNPERTTLKAGDGNDLMARLNIFSNFDPQGSQAVKSNDTEITEVDDSGVDLSAEEILNNIRE